MADSEETGILRWHLNSARDALRYKVEGLSEADRRRPMTPTGTNLIGVVKHMTWIESWYLCHSFGREYPKLAWEDDYDASVYQWSDMYAKPEETTEELLAAYAAATAAADRTLDDLDLDTMGHHPMGHAMSLRALAMIVLLDTTRHAGHSDIVRELIDGRTGDRGAPTHWESDEEHRQTYLARVRGEIDTPTWSAYIKSRVEPAG